MCNFAFKDIINVGLNKIRRVIQPDQWHVSSKILDKEINYITLALRNRKTDETYSTSKAHLKNYRSFLQKENQYKLRCE